MNGKELNQCRKGRSRKLLDYLKWGFMISARIGNMGSPELSKYCSSHRSDVTIMQQNLSRGIRCDDGLEGFATEAMVSCNRVTDQGSLN